MKGREKTRKKSCRGSSGESRSERRFSDSFFPPSLLFTFFLDGGKRFCFQDWWLMTTMARSGKGVGVNSGTGAATLQGLSESRVGPAWRGRAV